MVNPECFTHFMDSTLVFVPEGNVLVEDLDIKSNRDAFDAFLVKDGFISFNLSCDEVLFTACWLS
jgi:hypothetical protein